MAEQGDLMAADWRSHPKADQAVEFFRSLTLIGDYSGQRWELEPFQEEVIRDLYGKRNPDGTRATTKVSLWMGRGTGKTQIAAGLALYELLCGPPGREVYAAAPDKDKSSRLYMSMVSMIRANPHLARMCVCSDHYKRIKVPKRNSIFEALASDQDQGHSLAPSTLILDEVHLWKYRARQLYDALTSGFHKRREGSTLEVQISTAGNTRSGLPWDLYSYAKSVRDGVIDDPKTLVRIFEAPEDADFTDPAVWRLAMPCKYVNFARIAEECKLAQHLRYKQASFRQLYLGHWIEWSDQKWIAPEEWRACHEDYAASDLHGEEVFAALDLSSVRDLTSLSVYAPASGRCLSWSWLPGEGLAEREERDGVTYYQWHQDGHLFLTSGSRIVHQEVGEKVNEILADFKVTKLVADPYSLHLIAPHLAIEPEKYPQNPGWMSPPTKWFESAVASRKVRSKENPLLDWAVGNIVVAADQYENISPHKGKSRKRIDPAVAIIMAVGAWLGTGKVEDGGSGAIIWL